MATKSQTTAIQPAAPDPADTPACRPVQPAAGWSGPALRDSLPVTAHTSRRLNPRLLTAATFLVLAAAAAWFFTSRAKEPNVSIPHSSDAGPDRREVRPAAAARPVRETGPAKPEPGGKQAEQPSEAVPAAREPVARAPGNAESFRSRLVATEGDKVREKDVAVVFEDRRMLIRSRGTGLDLKVFPYGSIRAAEYSYSIHPLWQSQSSRAAILALPMFFMKGRKHWLAIKAADDFAVLRLDKNSYRVVIAALESHTSRKVEDLGEEKK